MDYNNVNFPKITVAMVTYNSGQYVDVAMKSVLSSTFTNFEFIIQDDCSTDNTWEIINSFDDKRIFAGRNLENKGEYQNRKFITEKAKGTYLIFIDGDDFIYPFGLDIIVKTLDAFPDCGMAVMGTYRTDVIYPIVLEPKEYVKGEWFGDGFSKVGFTSLIFNVEKLKEVGGIPTEFKAGDTILRRKLGIKYPSLIINGDLTWWRQTPNQASQRIQNDIYSLVDSVKYDYAYFLESKAFLSKSETELAFANFKKDAIGTAIKLIKKKKISDARFYLKNVPIKLSVVDFLIKKHKEKLFPQHDVTNPRMKPIEENPLGVFYKGGSGISANILP